MIFKNDHIIVDMEKQTITCTLCGGELSFFGHSSAEISILIRIFKINHQKCIKL